MLPWVLLCAAGARFDCTKTLTYGDKAIFRVARPPAALTFYAAANPARGAELSVGAWSPDGWWAEEGRGPRAAAGGELAAAAADHHATIWYLQKNRVTQRDQGVYSVRQRDGAQIYRPRLCVQGQKESRTVNASEDVDVTFAHSVVDGHYDLTFRPSDDVDRRPDGRVVAVVTELVREGRPYVGAQRGDRRVVVDNVAPTGLTLRNVQPADSGTYHASDRQGNRFFTLELTVCVGVTADSEAGSSLSWFLLKRVLVVTSALMLVCFLRKFCCTCDRAKGPALEPLPPYNHHGDEELNQPPVPSDHTLYGVIAPVTVHVWPPSEDEAATPYPEGPPCSLESNDDDVGPRGCYHPVSSGPAPSSSPLGDVLHSDTPTCDVYTSDKLNFL